MENIDISKMTEDELVDCTVSITEEGKKALAMAKLEERAYIPIKDYESVLDLELDDDVVEGLEKLAEAKHRSVDSILVETIKNIVSDEIDINDTNKIIDIINSKDFAIITKNIDGVKTAVARIEPI